METLLRKMSHGAILRCCGLSSVCSCAIVLGLLLFSPQVVAPLYGQTPPETDKSEVTESKESSENKAPQPESTDSPSRASSTQNPLELSPRLRELLDLATDNSVSILKREMPAYWGLIDQVSGLTVPELSKDAVKNPRFHDYYSKASQHRGELVTTVMHIRRVLSYPVDPSLGHKTEKLYELWGWTDESKAWMYCIVTPSLPPDFPEDGDVEERVRVAGYFFKLQGYRPGNAEPSSSKLAAPLIIGKIDWLKTTEEPPSRSNNLIMIFACLFAVGIILRILMRVRHGFINTKPAHLELRRRLRAARPEFLEDDDEEEEPKEETAKHVT